MILHVDLDAFYASVEQRDDPSLQGRPVLVGSPSQRAVVLAASYEARPFGCRSAMPMASARRLCPHAVVVRPRPKIYAEVSRAFREILDRFTPLVEPISIDEAFLDVAGTERLHGPPPAVGRAIKQAVRGELALVASVGVAPTKFVAKLASDLGKPDGLLVVAADRVTAFLAPLPVDRIFGVGAKTAARLRSLGLATCGELARYPTAALQSQLGSSGPLLQALARGEDPRHVEPDRAAVSIGAEETFEHDLVDGPELRRHVLAQADRVAERLRRAHLRASVVTLKLKDPEFHVTSRRRTLDAATSDGRVLARVALELLDRERIKEPGVRLCGVSAGGLEPEAAPRQLALDAREVARGERLGQTLDKIRDRFGARSVGRAELLDEESDE